MIARKLDSDFTIVKRMVRREARKLVLEVAPTLRSQKFVRNYQFGGGGTGGFGGNNDEPAIKVTGVVYDPANPGTSYVQTRSKLKGVQGVFLHDNPGEDAINIVGSCVNDPMALMLGL